MPVSTYDPETVRGRARRTLVALAAAFLAVAAPVAPALAQVTTVDPDAAIDADLNPAPAVAPAPSGELPAQPAATPATGNGTPLEAEGGVANWQADQLGTPAPGATSVPPVQDTSSTYREDDLIGAAEGVFGKGAKGLADLIKDLLAKQGEPNGYIVGREAGGAIAVGLRYGSGTLHHKIEGEQPVYWTGPSIGFDAGANAASAFVLVYNLYDSEDLFHRFGAGEGQAYLVGGFTVSYLRRGNIVLIPVRAGAGLRLGANIGYMKFSHKQKWLPF
ncbi:DUF1134 domain-containing protein [Novosphingobium album (ex Hu et al. 2023)]|uniref:DUF1134 domain-containing protein n=1 Tax=Novosphingobium album (ex Hu et al. 2023) TaxID=2930093 RepID=A0ABT0B4I6_9SPHN|nr:DUF1134 domain-containing protein [Novosphingobium album (ex Hu et al. 2023)]MCJ2179982.1 DUF1134 domain-containing protein [Novosphingobium album (ex Hu et al. 2023)]